jgi:uncharacterized protein (DUF697 family)
MVLLNKVDQLDGDVDALLAELERRLAASVLPVSARDGFGIESLLLPRILDAHPALILALGRELPSLRHSAAARIVRHAAVLSGLTGMEPVPLVDIPVQWAAQMRMLLKLAALYGRLESGDGTQELVVAVAGGLGLRLVAQQAAKLVPLLGWIVSGVVSALTTWCLGQAAVTYLNGSLEHRVPLIGHVSKARHRLFESDGGPRREAACGRPNRTRWVPYLGARMQPHKKAIANGSALGQRQWSSRLRLPVHAIRRRLQTWRTKPSTKSHSI